MIIGISGKIGSGKDTVGKIIQYLQYVNSDIHEGRKLSYEAFVKTNRSNNLLISGSIFEIVKYADALKDIICILTGCTREQLEDIEFKNSKLPDEWNIDKWDALQCTNIKKAITYRELLQKLGTNLLRNQLHENVWINALFSKYKGKELRMDFMNVPPDGHYERGEWHEVPDTKPNWIITDVRFENEAKAVKDRKGILIRVNRAKLKIGDWFQPDYQNEKIQVSRIDIDIRDNCVVYYNDKNSFTREDNIIFNEHSSETALDDYSFDYIIDNNGTIEDLIESVKYILIKEKII